MSTTLKSLALVHRSSRRLCLSSGQRPPAAALSPRELDVLRLVADGLSNRAIGERLFVGESTVKTHLLHVFAKLDVADRTRAVTRAMELGIL